MAYFPNATSGLVLEEQCFKCIHEDETALCPIANAHLLFNYKQCENGQEKLRQCLSALVDDTGKCLIKPLIEKYYKKKPLEVAVSEVKYKKDRWEY